MDSSVAFGVRKQFRIRLFRGVGITATDVIQIQHTGNSTNLPWCPVVRLSPLLFLAVVAGGLFVLFDGNLDFPAFPAASVV